MFQTDYNSGRRLRHCHCGWSKVTTYQGLRTHQGKRGCTPKGVEVKEHDQHYYGRGNGGYQYNQKDQYLDDYNSDYIGEFYIRKARLNIMFFPLIAKKQLKYSVLFSSKNG